jgi:hypothetical protein
VGCESPSRSSCCTSSSLSPNEWKRERWASAERRSEQRGAGNERIMLVIVNAADELLRVVEVAIVAPDQLKVVKHAILIGRKDRGHLSRKFQRFQKFKADDFFILTIQNCPIKCLYFSSRDSIF